MEDIVHAWLLRVRDLEVRAAPSLAAADACCAAWLNPSGCAQALLQARRSELEAQDASDLEQQQLLELKARKAGLECRVFSLRVEAPGPTCAQEPGESEVPSLRAQLKRLQEQQSSLQRVMQQEDKRMVTYVGLVAKHQDASKEATDSVQRNLESVRAAAQEAASELPRLQAEEQALSREVAGLRSLQAARSATQAQARSGGIIQALPRQAEQVAAAKRRADALSAQLRLSEERLFAERAERAAAIERRNVLEQQVQEANAACRACMSIEL